MILVITLGIVAGVGIVGFISAFGRGTLSLDAVFAKMYRPLENQHAVGPAVDGAARTLRFAGHRVLERYSVDLAEAFDRSAWRRHPRWKALVPSMAIVEESSEGLAAKILVSVGAALVGPPVLWLVAAAVGVPIAIGVPIVLTLIAVPIAATLPILSLLQRARDRRRHVRVVLGSFVDLVVLSLAGGVGVEGSLLAAAQVTQDWAARRIGRALGKARESGQSPWVALGRLGEEIGVSEMVELATTLELAGTEGARIRQALSARAASLRRHEQADAESAANAVTERLFLPGALLLLGFLLFVGYPAFSRIIGGF